MSVTRWKAEDGVLLQSLAAASTSRWVHGLDSLGGGGSRFRDIGQTPSRSKSARSCVPCGNVRGGALLHCFSQVRQGSSTSTEAEESPRTCNPAWLRITGFRVCAVRVQVLGGRRSLSGPLFRLWWISANQARTGHSSQKSQPAGRPASASTIHDARQNCSLKQCRRGAAGRPPPGGVTMLLAAAAAAAACCCSCVSARHTVRMVHVHG
jgi:hypothetical protein